MNLGQKWRAAMNESATSTYVSGVTDMKEGYPHLKKLSQLHHCYQLNNASISRK